MIRKPRPGAALSIGILGILGLILASCATSSGSTYSRAASSESGAAREGRAERPAPPPPAAPRERSGTSFIVVESEPEPEPTGHLVLEGLGQGASVYVDGSYRAGSRIELPVGDHDVIVKRFGYEDFEATVFIPLGADARLRVDLVPAAFSIRSVESEEPAFDPADPGYLGTCRIWIESTAPGKGSVAVRDASGRELRSLGAADFNSERILVIWDGRDDSGRVLEPGRYEIAVEGEGAQGKDRGSAFVELIAGRRSRSSSLHGGVSGSLFSPDARCLELGRFESSAGAVFHVDPAGSSMTGMGTVEAGIRIGLGRRPAALELDASVMGVIWPADPLANSASVSASFKRSFISEDGRRAAGIYVRASYAAFTDPRSGDAKPSWDGAARYPGLALGLPLELAFDRSRIFLSPEVEVSDYYPYWFDSTLPWSPPGLFAWGYLRAGVEASIGRSLTLTFSGALRTEPFGSAFGVRWPLPLGLEARWHARSLPLTLSFAATGEIDSLDAYYFGAGAFASFRF